MLYFEGKGLKTIYPSVSLWKSPRFILSMCSKDSGRILVKSKIKTKMLGPLTWNTAVQPHLLILEHGEALGR